MPPQSRKDALDAIQRTEEQGGEGPPKKWQLHRTKAKPNVGELEPRTVADAGFFEMSEHAHGLENYS